jgi:hypothetical protein
VTARAADEMLVGFTRALGRAGLRITPARSAAFLDASAALGLGQPRGVFWAGRATLCSSPADLARYDAVFARWFDASPADTRPPRPTAYREEPRAGLEAPPPGGGPAGPEDDAEVTALASAAERLRRHDIATLSAAERTRLARQFASLRRPDPRRRTRRRRPDLRGAVHPRRTLAQQARRLGEPGEVVRRRRPERPRRVVLLVDVSGSMTAYAESLLRLAHHWVGGGTPVEVFTVGTRATRVTEALHDSDPDRALRRVAGLVPDWSGGTRLGDTLRDFLDRWGAAGCARGAVVVVLSDGWERDGGEVLGEQMRRLRLLASRVVWASPNVAKPGYEPVQQGIVAAWPHIDDFVAGHSLQAFDELAEVVSRA